MNKSPASYVKQDRLIMWKLTKQGEVTAVDKLAFPREYQKDILWKAKREMLVSCPGRQQGKCWCLVLESNKENAGVLSWKATRKILVSGPGRQQGKCWSPVLESNKGNAGVLSWKATREMLVSCPGKQQGKC